MAITLKQIKEKVKRDCGVYGASHLKNLIEKGLLPQTKAHMENWECDLRSVQPWIYASDELKLIHPIEIVKAQPW